MPVFRPAFFIWRSAIKGTVFGAGAKLRAKGKAWSANRLQALAWWCGRWDLNPHTEVPAPKTGASAIPPLPHICATGMPVAVLFPLFLLGGGPEAERTAETCSTFYFHPEKAPGAEGKPLDPRLSKQASLL